jgi:hypothetical protein
LKNDGQVVHRVLGVAENNRRRGIFNFDDPHQRPVFAHSRHDVVNVFALGDVHLVAAQAEQLRLLQKLSARRTTCGGNVAENMLLAILPVGMYLRMRTMSG